MEITELISVKQVIQAVEEEKEVYKPIDEAIERLIKEKNEIETSLSVLDTEGYDADDYMRKKELETKLKSVTALLKRAKDDREKLVKERSDYFYKAVTGSVNLFGEIHEESSEELVNTIQPLIEGIFKALKKYEETAEARIEMVQSIQEEGLPYLSKNEVYYLRQRGSTIDNYKNSLGVNKLMKIWDEIFFEKIRLRDWWDY